MKEYIFVNILNANIEIKIKANGYIEALVLLSTVTKYYVENYRLQPDVNEVAA
jgi:hypothetical protein